MKGIALLLDLDGVIVKDKKLTPFGDTHSFISFLREKNIPFRVVSNNSRIPPKRLFQALKEKGIPLKEGELLTALMVAPQYLKRFRSVYPFCEKEVEEYLKEEGINVVDDYNVEAVFVGQNHRVSFERVKKATSALKMAKARLVAVNLNKLAKDSDGLFYPATGSWVEMFATATDYPKGEIVSLGKPSEQFFKLALKGFEDKEVYFVSDDFYTDLIPAERFGIKTIFATTGKYSKEDLSKASYQPFKVVDSLTELKEFLNSLL